MRIKRFFAPDIREAIRLVREEQGADAVILSNRQVDGGVELVAAVDYDAELVNNLAGNSRPPERPPRQASAEPAAAPAATAASATAREPARDAKILWSQEPALVAMRQELKAVRGLLEHQLSGFAWGDMARRHPMWTRLLKMMLESGFSPALAESITQRIPENVDFVHARRLALGMLARQLPVTDDDILRDGGAVVLMGSTGVGKTTTAAKLAARYALRHGAQHVALVTTDNFRIGAHEQLRTYAQVMDIPIRAVQREHELAATLRSLENKRLILIDTAGMSQRDQRLAEQLAMIRKGAQRVKSYLVLAAATQMQSMNEAFAAFRGPELKGCILTKLDEASSLGPALSVIIQHRLPVAYVSDGQRVPEDLHPARAHGLISRSVALSSQTRRAANAGQQRTLDDVSMALAFGRKSTNAHIRKL
jgi:flagellar biosynthesis protein FlhF